MVIMAKDWRLIIRDQALAIVPWARHTRSILTSKDIPPSPSLSAVEGPSIDQSAVNSIPPVVGQVTPGFQGGSLTFGTLLQP